MSEDHKIQQTMSMIGCSESEAKQYLEASDWDILKAIEQNIVVPVISGTRYIPETPVVQDGLTDEVREKLNAARAISDAFTFAHRNDLRETQSSAMGVSDEKIQVPELVTLAPLAELAELAEPRE